MTQNRKRGRPWKREAARLAANAIREGRFNDVTKAACAYFAQHIGRTASREMSYDEIKNGRQFETFKDFYRYIIEELNSEPKSMRVHRVLSKRSKKRNEQPKIREERRAKLFQHIRETLDTPAQRLKQEMEKSPIYQLRKARADLFPPDLRHGLDSQALFRMNRTGACNDRDNPE